MPFAAEARRVSTGLPPNDPLKIVLDFLLQNAVGSRNSVTIDDILGELQKHNNPMSREQFQQTILKETRDNQIFIGSSNEGCFLIDTQADAIKMRDFYAGRIRAEEQHLNHLRALSQTVGWQI